MHPDDAQQALDAGCDGLIVSNHAGRVLQGATISLHALAPIVERVNGRIPVLFDSGIRSGRDVFVALTLRQRCAGRSSLHLGLGNAGSDGRC